jgi:NAD+ kinase
MTTIQRLSPVSRVGIVAKSHLREAAPHLIDIEAWLAERGAHAVFETATAALIPDRPGRVVVARSELALGVDMVLVLGGDGTLLATADRIAAAGSQVPILGINFGSLGFLTEVTLPELYRALESALAGHAQIEHRLMLQATAVRRGTVVSENIAVNDVVITKGARSRMIDLSVWIGDEFVTRVRADGLIVATPTGSTAYNLAVGGPIVRPTVDALVVTPIAPHTLTNRPIVIPSSSMVRVESLMHERDEVFATFDGQTAFQLQPSDEVRIKQSKELLRLIRPSTRSYFEVLRQKLKWGER